MTATQQGTPADLGDIVVLLLAGTLAGLRDRLYEDGFERAGELVAELVDIADRYLIEVLPPDAPGEEAP